MKTKQVDPNDRRVHALILEQGDEVMSALGAFAREKNIRAAHFTALGAFERATLVGK